MERFSNLYGTASPDELSLAEGAEVVGGSEDD